MRLLKYPAVIAILAGIALAILTAVSKPASAGTDHMTPAARTCTAFKVWDHNRTMANLDTMLTVSETAPWAYVGTDAVVLYTDVRDRDSIDVRDDVKYMGEDCVTVGK